MRIRQVAAALRDGKTVESRIGNYPIHLAGEDSLEVFHTHEELRAVCAAAKILERPKPPKQRKGWTSAWTPK